MYPIGHEGRFLFTNWCLVKGRAVHDANRELATTIHELGHVFGAIDHYYDGTKASEDKHSTISIEQANPGQQFSCYCLYGEERSSPTIKSNMSMCAGCKHFIQNNPGRFDNVEVTS